MSPLVNETFWRERFGKVAPCWSGDRWLDWEHGLVMRAAFKRIWPRDWHRRWTDDRGWDGPAVRVLDVGCGDGRWSLWMQERFRAWVIGTDALEFPGVRNRVPFKQVDAESLTTDPKLVDWKPDVVVFMNSLTCMTNWRTAVREACDLAPLVLAFDNFMTPTPPWLKGLPHRRPIELPALVTQFHRCGFGVKEAVAADVMHRRLFLKTPRWLHPLVALTSAAIDLTVPHWVKPMKARHSAVLFQRRGARPTR
jgi:SAM-dependent methyltransferase